MTTRVLAINPWIEDFAAYDLWVRPLGLLYVAAALERAGCEVRVLDCLDRFYPDLPRSGRARPRDDAFGCGKFASTVLPMPAALDAVKRRWRRYGIPVDSFRRALAEMPPPDLVLVTSIMTYWYPGVFGAIGLVRQQFPSVPILLGGIYATLCDEHARAHSGADAVVASGDLRRVMGDVARWCSVDASAFDWPPDRPPRPAWHRWGNTSAVAVITGFGCPFNCTYCASRLLQPARVQFPVDYVVSELTACARRYGARDVAFYDDALLVNADRHLSPILDRVIAAGLRLRFHTPNGIHPRYMTRELTNRMRRAGFVTLRLSFESVSAERQRDSSNKVSTDELATAVENCRAAGFRPENVGVYALLGLPGQTRDEVTETMRTIHGLGATIQLAHFTPIPRTVEFERWLRATGADPAEPLLHNNTAYPYLFGDPLGPEAYDELARLGRELNRALCTRP